MPAPGTKDPHRALRDHLVANLSGGHAHIVFEDAIAGWPAELRGTKPAGQPFTAWRLLEHIRISQWDIVEFAKSAEHVSPKWPEGYWPREDAPPDAAAWDKSVAQVGRDLKAMDYFHAFEKATEAANRAVGLPLQTRLDFILTPTLGLPPMRIEDVPAFLGDDWSRYVRFVLPVTFARVPANTLPVVTTTWALSHFPLESRLRFLHRLDEAAGRTVAWVSVEGVGVAPTIPTLGDRRASGHSIIGLAVLDRSALRAEAVGRCWSQGRMLAWLADS